MAEYGHVCTENRCFCLSIQATNSGRRSRRGYMRDTAGVMEIGESRTFQKSKTVEEREENGGWNKKLVL